MKTILRIIVILMVAAVVAGAFSLAVNNGSTTANSNSSNNLSTTQPMARPEGSDHDSGSITQGLAGIAGTLMQLSGISILVLILQKAFRQFGGLKIKFAQR